MIFELDPLITEEQPDEIEEQAETSEKLQKFMEYRDPSEDLKEVSLLKTIGVPHRRLVTRIWLCKHKKLMQATTINLYLKT